MAVSPYLGFEIFKTLRQPYCLWLLKMKKPQAWSACGCVFLIERSARPRQTDVKIKPKIILSARFTRLHIYALSYNVYLKNIFPI
jgi:hypothetical protein